MLDGVIEAEHRHDQIEKHRGRDVSALARSDSSRSQHALQVLIRSRQPCRGASDVDQRLPKVVADDGDVREVEATVQRAERRP